VMEQPIMMLNVLASSRAGSLPQGIWSTSVLWLLEIQCGSGLALLLILILILILILAPRKTTLAGVRACRA
jgi:hypothetical protein